MNEFLWIGTLLGAIVGLLHALNTLSTRLKHDRLRRMKTAWQSIWTIALWTLFGAYVLAFWIIGAVIFGISRLLGKGMNRHDQR